MAESGCQPVPSSGVGTQYRCREELPAYLTHRLHLAGCELPLFEPSAIEALFQATQGMPRKINRLAHYALTSAAIDKAKVVAIKHVQAAREEIAP